MKKTILVYVLVVMSTLGVFSLSTPKYMYSKENKEVLETDPIILEGKFKTGGLRSGTDPIIAVIQDELIVIRFQKNLGLMNITINGPSGVTFNTTVNTDAAPYTLSIPIDDLPAGIYTILFSNQLGEMQGSFILP